jgi:hypothetical protein
MTKIENLDGVGEQVFHHTPNPARSVGQYDHFRGLRAARLSIDRRKEVPKRLTVGNLRAQNLVQDFVSLLTNLRYILPREREHGFGFSIPLILWALPGLPRRTQMPIDL